MNKPIMDKARERGAFKRPDIAALIPKGMEDTVARLAAAGQRLMYSPDMRDELQAEVGRDAPNAQKMAEAVSGLMLTLDAKSKGGIPEAAIFPAALDLLGEAAEVLAASGQAVTQEDYNDAARQVFVLLGRKLGYDDEQLMGAAAQGAGLEPQTTEPAEHAQQEPADEDAAMQEGVA